MLMIVNKECTTVSSDRPLPNNVRDYQKSLLDVLECYNSVKPTDWAEMDRLTLNADTATLFLNLADGTRYRLPYYGEEAESLLVSYKNTVLFLLEKMGKVEESDE